MNFCRKSKRTLPPLPRRGTGHSRLRLIGLLSAISAAALLIAGCPPPGEVFFKNAVFTTTVSGIVQDKGFGTGLSGVKISALTAPANPENKPAESGPEGSFTLQVKHSGKFQLALQSTCYTPFTTADISASADGSHDAGGDRFDGRARTNRHEPLHFYTEEPAGGPAGQ